MPRIYALAKKLKMDSKELVDICNKVGLTSKGSALANLSQEEETKVLDFISGKSTGSAKSAAPSSGGAPPMQRPASSVGRGGKKPPTLVAKKKAPVEVAPEEVAEEVAAPAPVAQEVAAPEPVAEVPAAPETVAEEVAAPAPVAEKVAAAKPTPVVEKPVEVVAAPAEPTPVVKEPAPAAEVAAEVKSAPTPPEKPKAAPAAKDPKPAPAAAKGEIRSTPLGSRTKSGGGFSRDEYIAPGGGRSGKPPVLMNKPRGKSGGEGQKKQEKKGPNIKLPSIPQAPQQPARQKPTERTQKPIISLPADAIKGAKAGGRAPLEQFTKQQEKKSATDGRAATKPKPGGRGKPGAQAPVNPHEVPQAGAAARGGKDRRRGAGTAEEGTGTDGEGKKLAGMASARASRQANRRRSHRQDDDDQPRRRRGPRHLQRKGNNNTAAPRKGNVIVELPCTVRSLSEGTGVPTVQIQRFLMGLGQMVTINAELDPETAEMIAAELGMEVEFRQPETVEDAFFAAFESQEDDPDALVTRPPIVTFLGHVDHGKTSLLDYLLGINVVDREAGGITQHIRAYKIEKDGREIAFVDTPGHEAFTEMRARGANVTDIAVLVVAADDGVMPQTEEAISHARAAGVPIVVALNKMDLPGADENKALQDLSTHGLLPTEWGGDIEVVKTSAISGDGMDELLETLLLTAEIHEFKANPERDAHGVCLEAQQDGDRGVVAKMIVTNGTLRVGDVVVCGGSFGRVKAMMHTLDLKRNLTEAGPSTPVSLIGLNIAPEAGEPFHVMQDISKAREIAETRSSLTRSRSLSGATVKISFDEFQRRLEEGRLTGDDEATPLNMILRADVRGSIEAIQKELEKLDHPEVKVNILQASVGGITSADVTLADASDAVVVGFNVIPDEGARQLAEQRGVEIRRYDIIYKVTEDLKLMLEGKLKPEERIADLGRALVQRLFTVSRFGTIAGCRVLAGKIERGCRIRVNRDGRGIGDYPLDSLRREKDDTKEVREGFECGMKLSGFNDLKEGDILEAYKIEEVARTL